LQGRKSGGEQTVYELGCFLKNVQLNRKGSGVGTPAERTFECFEEINQRESEGGGRSNSEKRTQKRGVIWCREYVGGVKSAALRECGKDVDSTPLWGQQGTWSSLRGWEWIFASCATLFVYPLF
jgi:hypothetical protein